MFICFKNSVCWNDIVSADDTLPAWFPFKRSWMCLRTGCQIMPSPANFEQIISFCIEKQMESIRVACNNNFSGVYLCPDFWQRFCVAPTPVREILKLCLGPNKQDEKWGETDWEAIRNVCYHTEINLLILNICDCGRWTRNRCT